MSTKTSWLHYWANSNLRSECETGNGSLKQSKTGYFCGSYSRAAVRDEPRYSEPEKTIRIRVNCLPYVPFSKMDISSGPIRLRSVNGRFDAELIPEKNTAITELRRYCSLIGKVFRRDRAIYKGNRSDSAKLDAMSSSLHSLGP